MIDYTEIIFYVSEIVMVLSYSATRMIILRLIACIADIGYMVAALLIGLHEPGMTPTFVFAVIAFLINSVHIYRILHMRIPRRLPAQYEGVYRTKFSSFTIREFLYLLDISTRVTHNNVQIIEEGKPCDIFLCLDGELSVKTGGKNVATLPAASMVGEVSSLTGFGSLASVSTVGAVQLCQWTKQSMQKLEKKYPEIHLKFHAILLGEMRSKLMSQNRSMAY